MLIANFFDNGKIPDNTGAGVFGSRIACLVDIDFIELIDSSDNNITQQIKANGRYGDWSLYRGYSVADFLKGKENYIRVSLTSKLNELQEALGFSVSKLIEEYVNPSISINPIFGKPNGNPKTDVFVLMPFNKDFSPIFDDHIVKICGKMGMECKRADNIFGSNEIISDIWELIFNSSIVIADCTGRNPNVFYELGIAHTLGKKVIIITQEANDIPFDISHIRYIKYEYTPRGMKLFEESLQKFIGEVKKHDNTVSS
jgi:hypothetical protein